MKYQQLKKAMKQFAFQLRFIVFPFIMIFAALPLLFSESFNPQALLWTIPMAMLAIAMFAYSFQLSNVLKRLRECVGATSEEEMDAIMDSATDFEGKMFVMKEYCFNTKTLNIYPLCNIRTLYTMTGLDKRNGHFRTVYCVRINHGEKNYDEVRFRNNGNQGALVQYLLDNAQGPIEVVRY